MNSYDGEQFSKYKSISVKDLQTFLDDFGKDFKVLSLDCFDTLLWRKFMSPIDVFFQLGKENKLPKGQLSVSQRVSAEKNYVILDLSWDCRAKSLWKRFIKACCQTVLRLQLLH